MNIKHQTIHYRNGIYQGPFDFDNFSRCGFGLLYSIHMHSIMASHWDEDQANGPTLIFHNHGHYMYGYWKNNLPDGLNSIRIGSSVFFAHYNKGRIQGNLLGIFEKYNLAVVLTVIDHSEDSEFELLQKGEIFSDGDFQRFVELCQWTNFESSFKTLIKFMSTHLTQDANQHIKRIKLRLVNESFYRYGFDEGIAIVFDDEYKVVSAGLHKKATLKSLGIKFTKDRFAEEGDFGENAQVFTFQMKQRPSLKIGKLYSNYLLKSTEFVNKFLGDPSSLFIDYYQSLLHQNIFKQILSGQITNRRLQLQGGTQRKSDNSFQSPPKIVNVFEVSKQEDDEEVKKMKLQILKKQIFDSIEKKKGKMLVEESPKMEVTERKKIISKSPVGKIAKVNEKSRQRKAEKKEFSSKKRQRIFTPEKSNVQPETEQSPPKYSPFKEKMRSKIFHGKNTVKIEPLEERKNEKQKSESRPNFQKYSSPHEALQYSLEENHQSPFHLPLSMKNQKSKSTKKVEKPILIEEQREKYQSPKKASPKRVSFADDDQFRGQKRESRDLSSSQKNRVYIHGQVNYQPITTDEIKKNSYYEKFQRKKSRSPYKEKVEKSPDKYTDIVKKFNESKNRPFDKYAQKAKAQESGKMKPSPSRRKYQYYFP